MSEIRLLSLWQPWASLIAFGLKQYETRSWSTKYRGKLAIHAAKRKVSREEILPIFYATGGGGVPMDKLDKLNHLLEDAEQLPLGAIVAIVDLVDCRQMISAHTTLTSFGKQPESVQAQQIPIVSLAGATDLEKAVGNWHPGRFAWRLENIHTLSAPILCKGAQGLRKFQHQAMLQEIDRQLGTKLSGAFPQIELAQKGGRS